MNAKPIRIQLRRVKGWRHSHLWICLSRDAKGKTWCIECSDPMRMAEDAVSGNAVAITLLRQRRTGKLPSIDKMMGIYKSANVKVQP